MIPGVGEICASIISASCDFSPDRLLIRWSRSDCHKHKRDSWLNTIGRHSMSQLTLALHHASLLLWYGISAKQRMEIRDLNPASSNLFLTDRGDTLPGFQLFPSVYSSEPVENCTIFSWCSPSGRTHAYSCHNVLLSPSRYHSFCS